MLNDQADVIGAVDMGRYVVGRTGPREGFSKVAPPMNAPAVAVLHQDTARGEASRLREQEQLAQGLMLSQPRLASKRNLETFVEYLPRPRQWGPQSRRHWRRGCCLSALLPVPNAGSLAPPTTAQNGAVSHRPQH